MSVETPRLRNIAKWGPSMPGDFRTILDAADEIDRLRAQIERVRVLCAERNEWLNDHDDLHTLKIGDVRVALVTVPDVLRALDGEGAGE